MDCCAVSMSEDFTVEYSTLVGDTTSSFTCSSLPIGDQVCGNSILPRKESINWHQSMHDQNGLDKNCVSKYPFFVSCLHRRFNNLPRQPRRHANRYRECRTFWPWKFRPGTFRTSTFHAAIFPGKDVANMNQ